MLQNDATRCISVFPSAIIGIQPTPILFLPGRAAGAATKPATGAKSVPTLKWNANTSALTGGFAAG